MSELKALDPDNKRYYLMDNARVHKSKTFNKYLEKNIMKIVYNEPYIKDKKILIFYLVHTINK